MWRNTYVQSWRGVNETAGFIPADEWEPIVPTKPYPEYASGSTMMCTAILTFVELRMKHKFGNDWEAPETKIYIPDGSFPSIPVSGDVTLVYKDLEEAKDECGRARLSGAVQCAPAVDAGRALGQEVGERAFETWKDLQEGRVPKHCHWCTRASNEDYGSIGDDDGDYDGGYDADVSNPKWI